MISDHPSRVWWVVVYAGRDPLTGRKRQKTGTRQDQG
jgi:Arm DNA-binding domain